LWYESGKDKEGLRVVSSELTPDFAIRPYYKMVINK